MNIGIITPTLIYNDAVCNDVFGMQQLFLKNGIGCNLYAENNHTQNLVFNLEKSHNEDLFIYHHSIGTKKCVDFIKDKKVLIKYHNITPPEFFDDEYTKDFCRLGYNQLTELENYNFICDSIYNSKSIKNNLDVIPPYNHIQKLLLCEPDRKSNIEYNDWKINILSVGRLSKNKNALDSIQIIQKLNLIANQYRLILVGEDSGDYAALLRDFITTNNIKNVVITGKVSLESLKSYYNIADVFLTTSKHEGFCVPVVEAMCHSIPVIYLHQEAINETCKGYGANCKDIDDIVDQILHYKNLSTKNGFGIYKKNYSSNIIDSKLLNIINNCI